MKDEYEIGGSQSGISFPFKSEKNVGFDVKHHASDQTAKETTGIVDTKDFVDGGGSGTEQTVTIIRLEDLLEETET